MKEAAKTYTIGDWLNIWFEVYAIPEYAANTVSLYLNSRKRVQKNFPDIENTELQAFLPVQFQAVMNKLAEKFSKSTIRHVKTLYNMAYDKAIDNQLCEFNPIKKTIVPKNASEKIVTALTQEEQRKFELAAKELPVKDRFILMTLLLTGMRPGELRYLKWSEWKKEERVLKISRSKTDAGVREIPVIPEVALMLTHLRAWVRDVGKKPYIFGGEMPLRQDHLRNICIKAGNIAEIRHVTPHMLRHTFATRMVDKKAEIKSLSMILGHKKPEFTLKRYVSPDHEQLYSQMMLLSHVGKVE